MRKKIIASVLIFIFFLIVMLTYFSYMIFINPNLTVDSCTIEEFANSYLDEYMKIIDEYFGHDDGYYFNFYKEQPFSIKSIVSDKNGVAIGITPNTEYTFELSSTEYRIETSVFEHNQFSYPIVNTTGLENVTRLIWGGDPDRPMIGVHNSYNSGSVAYIFS